MRQGCPLAPLLFSLTMQPLVLMLKEHAQEGRLRGIQIGKCGQEQLLCQMFADNTRVFLESTKRNFLEAMDVIACYERRGVKLSLGKSIIIQLDDQLEPTWV